MLYVFVIIYGIAQGGMGAAQSPEVADLFGLSSHGLLFGLTGLGFTSGAAFGPYITGLIFDITGSYQLAFLMCAAVAIIGLVMTTLIKPIENNQI